MRQLTMRKEIHYLILQLNKEGVQYMLNKYVPFYSMWPVFKFQQPMAAKLLHLWAWLKLQY